MVYVDAAGPDNPEAVGPLFRELDDNAGFETPEVEPDDGGETRAPRGRVGAKW
jgi:hypothetical protein